MTGARHRSVKTDAARKHGVMLVVAALVLTLIPVVLHARQASAFGEPCAPVMLYFSRGSGEADGLGSVGGALLGALKGTTQADVQGAANPYPAVAVGSPMDLYKALVGSKAYLDSVEFGAQFLAHDVTDLANRCSTSTLVVGGYSQGAEVTRYGLTRLSASVRQHIKAVALFGDPWFLSSEPNVIALGGFVSNLKGVHYAKSYFGVPNTTYPLLPTALPLVFKGRTVSFCHSEDPICQYSKTNFSLGIVDGFAAHMSYPLDSWAAAQVITPMLGLSSGGSTGGATSGTASLCETFVSDVTIPDGSVLSPGQRFTKTWRLRNCGTRAWTTGQAVRVSGNFGLTSFATPPARAGTAVNLSTVMTAPTSPGHYRATYRLRSPSGALGNNVFWVDLYVAAASHDCEAFVADLTIPDGTMVAAGQTVSKSWRLRNCGTTNWSGLTAVRTGGSFGPPSFSVPPTAPGATADLTAPVTAPSSSGLTRTTYRLQAADGHFADNSFWVEINVAAPPPIVLSVSSTSLPAATVGAAYAARLTAMGGTAPYRWAVTSGALPAGLTLAASTGLISGTPTTAGPAAITVEVTDAASATGTATLTLTVAPASPPSTATWGAATYFPTYLRAVSCASTSFCAAVDANGFAVTWDGSTWSTPVAVDPGVALNGVSCVSSSFCVAVSGSPGTASFWNGTSWSTPVTTGDGSELDAVSCSLDVLLRSRERRWAA